MQEDGAGLVPDDTNCVLVFLVTTAYERLQKRRVTVGLEACAEVLLDVLSLEVADAESNAALTWLFVFLGSHCKCGQGRCAVDGGCSRFKIPRNFVELQQVLRFFDDFTCWNWEKPSQRLTFVHSDCLSYIKWKLWCARSLLLPKLAK